MTVVKLLAIALTTLLAGPALAQQCETQIEGNDQTLAVLDEAEEPTEPAPADSSR
mgnify:CR=1 FL=1